MDRLLEWACGDYKVNAKSGELKLRVDASIGLAEHTPNETLKQLLARADTAMYAHKASTRTYGSGSRR
jgi:PleD family two-component response regulator